MVESSQRSVVFSAVVAIVLAGRSSDAALLPSISNDLRGQAAQVFQTETIEGEPFTSEQLAGRQTLVNFFASWCVACKQEAPLLHAEALKRAGTVLFLGIDVQDLTGDARSFARKYGIDYVAVRDESNAIYNAYGLTGVPETYFIDARGRAVAHIPGEATHATLSQGIASITSAKTGGALPGGAHVTGP